MIPTDVTQYHYRAEQLHCEDVSLAALVKTYGTPLYVYSQQALQARVTELRQALGNSGHACYAVKANQTLGILRLFAENGLGADVTSGGELYLALHAGFAPQDILYSGVGKTETELRFAIETGLRAIHVESVPELQRIETLAAEYQRVVNIGVRVNPDIDVPTHPYISTGAKEHKFGVPPTEAVQLLMQAQLSPWLNPVGIASHIGSQIMSLKPFAAAAEFLAGLASELTGMGIALEYVDVGGGVGISYAGQEPIPLTDWINTIKAPIAEAGFSLAVEPGRSLVGPAGALLTEITYVKDNGHKQFAIADAGMNDLLRPTLYQAKHPLLPVQQSNNATVLYDVVGPICESGDFLAKGYVLPKVEQGDLLCVLQAGAYGFAMSSNYNGRLRAAEVLVNGDQVTMIRERETYADLVRLQ